MSCRRSTAISHRAMGVFQDAAEEAQRSGNVRDEGMQSCQERHTKMYAETEVLVGSWFGRGKTKHSKIGGA